MSSPSFTLQFKVNSSLSQFAFELSGKRTCSIKPYNRRPKTKDYQQLLGATGLCLSFSVLPLLERE